MECRGYELIALSLGLITAISEALGLIKHIEFNGILDFIIRVMTARQHCADEMDTCELANVPTNRGLRQRQPPNP
jgi:hypothetical protein